MTMIEELKEITQNYTMGFITPTEYILQYSDVLRMAGADKPLRDALNNLVADLASHLTKVVVSNGSVAIEDFEKEGI